MPPNAALRRRSAKSFPARPTRSMVCSRRHRPRTGSPARRLGLRLRPASVTAIGASSVIGLGAPLLSPGKSRGAKPAAFGSLDQVAIWIGENDGTHGLVIFDVAGTAAEMAVERLPDGFVEIAVGHALFCQALQ